MKIFFGVWIAMIALAIIFGTGRVPARTSPSTPHPTPIQVIHTLTDGEIEWQAEQDRARDLEQQYQFDEERRRQQETQDMIDHDRWKYDPDGVYCQLTGDTSC